MTELLTYEKLADLGLIHKFQKSYNPYDSSKARSIMSDPLKELLTNEYIQKGDKVLDFGAGRLRDVYDLISFGVKAKGYDPYADYYSKKDEVLLNEEYDVVMANFVFDIIKERKDHRKALKEFRKINSKKKYISFDNRFFSRNTNWKYDSQNKIYFTGEYYQRYYRPNDLFIWFGKHEVIKKGRKFTLIEIL